MRTLLPGEWYLLFNCKVCGALQVLFPDLSQGKASIKRATYVASCRYCAYRAEYTSERIKEYQHPPRADSARA
jgi:hypothetical protein